MRLRDTGLVPGSRRCAGEGNGNPLQCSCLENPMDKIFWRAGYIASQRVSHDWSDLARFENKLNIFKNPTSLEFDSTTLEWATEMYISYFGVYENTLNLGTDLYWAILNELAFNVRGIRTYLQNIIFWELQGSLSPNLLVHILSPSEIPTVALSDLSLELENQSNPGIFYPVTLLQLFLFPQMPLSFMPQPPPIRILCCPQTSWPLYYLPPFSSWWKTICPSPYEVIPMIPFSLCPKDLACLFVTTHSMKYCYWEMCNSQLTLIRHF